MKKKDIELFNEILAAENPHMLKPGDKVWVKKEKQAYTVQAADGRFKIMTKPFNAKKTCLYSIIDIERKERGTENLIFCMGFETKDKCEEALLRLQTNESEVSHRNYVALDIVRIKQC